MPKKNGRPTLYNDKLAAISSGSIFSSAATVDDQGRPRPVPPA